MLTPQFLLDIHRELAVDLFAGGGGASTGIEQAIGRAADISINHDAEAVSLHEANHPQTKHFVSDVFAAATHAAPASLPVRQKKLKPWRTAAECIDWSLPCPSIFERKRPLAEATLRRIAKGVMRYVVNAPQPFIVPGQIAPFLTEHANASSQRNFGADEPLRTQVAQVKGGHFALVSAFLAKHYGGVVGTELPRPLSTVTTQDHHSLVTSNLVKLRGTSKEGQPVDEPLHTISAGGMHHAEVRAFLVKYYGADQAPRLEEPMHTVTTIDRFGLVIVHGEPYAIVDIGMRMLQPRELYTAQGFPANYIIDCGADGHELTKKAQVRLCGNSVCPPLARAIVAANYYEQLELVEAA